MSRYQGTPEPDYVEVGRVQDLPPGRMRCVEVDGRSVALVNLDGTLYAMDNNCPHNGGPLADGSLDVAKGQVTCPWHAWTWDVRTGRAVAPPVAAFRVANHSVRVEGDLILVSRYPA